ncbi:hypothetical protein ACFFH4_26130 [Halalkalibacter alkalisediminis]|uniref:Uncharacterized protein n=1 Tax=Halalkalibacter alkalisediminis TaxID=935616 RepID=A0ABV6NNJ5_9BACI
MIIKALEEQNTSAHRLKLFEELRKVEIENQQNMQKKKEHSFAKLIA